MLGMRIGGRRAVLQRICTAVVCTEFKGSPVIRAHAVTIRCLHLHIVGGVGRNPWHYMYGLRWHPCSAPLRQHQQTLPEGSATFAHEDKHRRFQMTSRVVAAPPLPSHQPRPPPPHARSSAMPVSY